MATINDKMLDGAGVAKLSQLIKSEIAQGSGLPMYLFKRPERENPEDTTAPFQEGEAAQLQALWNNIGNKFIAQWYRYEEPTYRDFDSIFKEDGYWDEDAGEFVEDGGCLRLSFKDDYETVHVQVYFDGDGNLTSNAWQRYERNQSNMISSYQVEYYDMDTYQSTTANDQFANLNKQVKRIVDVDNATITKNVNNVISTAIGGSKQVANPEVLYGLKDKIATSGSFVTDDTYSYQYYIYGDWQDKATEVGESVAVRDYSRNLVYVAMVINGQLKVYACNKEYWRAIPQTPVLANGELKEIYFSEGYAQIQLYQDTEDTFYTITEVYISGINKYSIEYSPMGAEYLPVGNTTKIENNKLETVIGGYQERVHTGNIVATILPTENRGTYQYDWYNNGSRIRSPSQYNPPVIDVDYTQLETGVAKYYVCFSIDGTDYEFGPLSYEDDHNGKWLRNNVYSLQLQGSSEDSTQNVFFYPSSTTILPTGEITKYSLPKFEVYDSPSETIIHTIDSTYIPVDNQTVKVVDGKLAASPDMSTLVSQTEFQQTVQQLESSIPANTSDLVNDSEFVTSSTLGDFVTKDEADELIIDETKKDNYSVILQSLLGKVSSSSSVSVDNLDDFVAELRKGRIVKPSVDLSSISFNDIFGGQSEQRANLSVSVTTYSWNETAFVYGFVPHSNHYYMLVGNDIFVSFYNETRLYEAIKDLISKNFKATSSSLGMVKPDGTTIIVDENGVISSQGGSSGVEYTADSGIEISEDNKISAPGVGAFSTLFNSGLTNNTVSSLGGGWVGDKAQILHSLNNKEVFIIYNRMSCLYSELYQLGFTIIYKMSSWPNDGTFPTPTSISLSDSSTTYTFAANECVVPSESKIYIYDSLSDARSYHMGNLVQALRWKNNYTNFSGFRLSSYLDGIDTALTNRIPSSLVSEETTPTTNNTINWQYE